MATLSFNTRADIHDAVSVIVGVTSAGTVVGRAHEHCRYRSRQRIWKVSLPGLSRWTRVRSERTARRYLFAAGADLVLVVYVARGFEASARQYRIGEQLEASPGLG